MPLEITSCYVAEETCDLCGSKGTPRNQVIEFLCIENDGANFTVHQQCLGKMLSERGISLTRGYEDTEYALDLIRQWLPKVSIDAASDLRQALRILTLRCEGVVENVRLEHPGAELLLGQGGTYWIVDAQGVRISEIQSEGEPWERRQRAWLSAAKLKETKLREALQACVNLMKRDGYDNDEVENAEALL